jgi:hypothetical protein
VVDYFAMNAKRSAIWRSGEYLGLVSDRPKPRLGSGGWWRTVLLIGVIVTIALAVANFS